MYLLYLVKHCTCVISDYDKWRIIASKVMDFQFSHNDPNFLISLDSQDTIWPWNVIKDNFMQ